MNTWDTINTANEIYNEDTRRREKAYQAQANSYLHEEERAGMLTTLTGAIRQRLTKAQNNQATAPETHNPETIRA